MPRVKERSNLAHEIQEQRYAKGLKGLEDGTYKTLSEAAVSNQLSKSSLGHRRIGRRSRQEAHQDEQIFSPVAEKAIVKWILKLDDYGFSPRVDILMGLVKNLAKEEAARQVPVRNFAVGKKPAQSNLIGKNWVTCFLNCHPNLAVKFAGRIDRQCAHAGNPYVINTHFIELGKIIRSGQFSPRTITNIDGKGFLVGLSPRTRVITRRGKKNPHVKQDGKRDSITALEAVSADGFVFPPYLISKGSIHVFSLYKHVTAENRDARWAVSLKGWTDSKIGYDWLTNVYDPISKAHCEPRLLILDGHVSHINFEFLRYCKNNDICVFCLPPHNASPSTS